MSFEVLNGFAERADARSALQKVAIVPIPAGSGNGFSCNLLGVKVFTLDASHSAANNEALHRKVSTPLLLS